LVIGMGTPFVRFFAEQLYKELAVDLKEKNIQSSFLFLGSNREEINQNFNRIDKEVYDAALVLKQVGNSYYVESYLVSELPRLSIKFDQELSIQLIEFPDENNSIW